MRSLFSLLLAMSCLPASAADWTASSCSFADVQSAYNSASDGDRVLIPTCSSTSWSTNTLTVSKAVQILGNGVANTILVNAKFTVTVADGKAWRIGGFTTSGTTGFNVTGCSKSGRMDNIKFTGGVTGFTENRVFWLSPNSGCYNAGLIDHIEFAPGSAALNSIQIHVREGDGGNDSWTRPLDLGGADAWYIEDSTFRQTAAFYNISAPLTDCDGGGRFVFRYNTIYNNYTEMHDAIVAGLRSCRKWEQYENNWATTGADYLVSGQWAQIAIRGGTGVVFNNTFNTDTTANIIFSAYRTEQTGETPWGDCPTTAKACVLSGSTPVSCTTDAQCSGVSGACMTIDGNGRGTGLSGYPCRDQMGTDGSNSQQNIRPALFWNNIVAGSQFDAYYEGTGLSTYLAEGRDYCLGTGNGSGKPTTCAGRNTPYTAYTYPHPLQTPTQAPKKPTGVN